MKYAWGDYLFFATRDARPIYIIQSGPCISRLLCKFCPGKQSEYLNSVISLRPFFPGDRATRNLYRELEQADLFIPPAKFHLGTYNFAENARARADESCREVEKRKRASEREEFIIGSCRECKILTLNMKIKYWVCLCRGGNSIAAWVCLDRRFSWVILFLGLLRYGAGSLNFWVSSRMYGLSLRRYPNKHCYEFS